MCFLVPGWEYGRDEDGWVGTGESRRSQVGNRSNRQAFCFSWETKAACTCMLACCALLLLTYRTIKAYPKQNWPVIPLRRSKSALQVLKLGDVNCLLLRTSRKSASCFLLSTKRCGIRLGPFLLTARSWLSRAHLPTLAARRLPSPPPIFPSVATSYNPPLPLLPRWRPLPPRLRSHANPPPTRPRPRRPPAAALGQHAARVTLGTLVVGLVEVRRHNDVDARRELGRGVKHPGGAAF